MDLHWRGHAPARSLRTRSATTPRSRVRPPSESTSRNAASGASQGRQAFDDCALTDLLVNAAFEAVRVSPWMVYMDASKPTLVDGFIRRTFAAMIEGVRLKRPTGRIRRSRFVRSVHTPRKSCHPTPLSGGRTRTRLLSGSRRWTLACCCSALGSTALLCCTPPKAVYRIGARKRGTFRSEKGTRAAGWTHPVPATTSTPIFRWSAWPILQRVATSFSTVMSATAQRNRPFSCSRTFSRFTWSTFKPKYSDRQRQYVASVTRSPAPRRPRACLAPSKPQPDAACQRPPPACGACVPSCPSPQCRRILISDGPLLRRQVTTPGGAVHFPGRPDHARPDPIDHRSSRP